MLEQRQAAGREHACARVALPFGGPRLLALRPTGRGDVPERVWVADHDCATLMGGALRISAIRPSAHAYQTAMTDELK